MTKRSLHLIVVNAILFVIISFLITYAIFFCTTTAFPIRHIKVHGQYQHVKIVDIERLTTPYVKTSFFDVDLLTIKQALLTLPWLQSVSVTRVWPATLNVVLQERIPVAIWNGDHLMTREAVLFSADVETFLNTLPIFLGPRGTEEEMLKKYSEFNEILSPLGLHIHQLRLTSNRVWSIRLDNDVELMLGENNADERLRRFVGVYTKIVTSNRSRAKRFDLRYGDGVAVAWQ